MNSKHISYLLIYEESTISIDFTNINTFLSCISKTVGGGNITVRKETQQNHLSEQTISKAFVPSQDITGQCQCSLDFNKT